MSLLNAIMKMAGDKALSKINNQFSDIDDDKTQETIGAILPHLAGALKGNLGSAEGMQGLLKALTSGNHSKYVDQPDEITTENGLSEGKAILGHLLGGKDKSRAISAEVAQKTGVDAGAIQKMLPMLATVLMGTVAKNKSTLIGEGEGAGESASGGQSMLMSFLDADNDGSVVDDLFAMAKNKLFS